jgi:hypothetical protein
VLSATDDEPKLVRETINLKKGKIWKDAMVKEMESLHNNETWDFINLSNGSKPVGRKWMFKKKLNVTGQFEKCKARLVVKGSSKVKGVDFSDIFSHVSKLTSIRVLMSLATSFDLEIDKMDVKTMFIHGDLEVVIYMKQPEGFVVNGNK